MRTERSELLSRALEHIRRRKRKRTNRLLNRRAPTQIQSNPISTSPSPFLLSHTILENNENSLIRIRPTNRLIKNLKLLRRRIIIQIIMRKRSKLRALAHDLSGLRVQLVVLGFEDVDFGGAAAAEGGGGGVEGAGVVFVWAGAGAVWEGGEGLAKYWVNREERGTAR